VRRLIRFYCKERSDKVSRETAQVDSVLTGWCPVIPLEKADRVGKAQAEDAEDRAEEDRGADLGEQADLGDLVAELAVLGVLLEEVGEAVAECLADAEG
jgi:hypothetical protein